MCIIIKQHWQLYCMNCIQLAMTNELETHVQIPLNSQFA